MSGGSNALGGKVWKFGDNINTDLMLPGPWLYRSADDQAKAVFINNRPEFLREMRQGDVIIGGFRRVQPPARYAIVAWDFCWPRP
jgi:3-isopropylmalate dehydratase small subunit